MKIFRLFVAFTLICSALLPRAQAVNPPPDGGYPNFNTAEGDNALFSLTTGLHNTALGFQALFSNTTGAANTAAGAYALFKNTTGNENTAVGGNALFSNTTGIQNVAIGIAALSSNTTGNLNTAIGVDALRVNTTGNDSVAIGKNALRQNTTGINNAAIGTDTLHFNRTGINNTAIGGDALRSSTTGFNNVAVGASALLNDTIGSVNIALGPGAGKNLTTGNRNIDIGNDGVAGESATIRIGTDVEQTRTFIAGIAGTTAADGVAVLVSTDGKLGTRTSSARFKDEIKPMDKASEALFALTPVAFRYKKDIDPAGIPQFGLVAEDVAKVNPALVVRDKDGKPYTVRYDAVNAMLLNEFLKEHRTVEEQKAITAELKSTVEKQQATNAQQQKQIEALTEGLQKVSAQLEASKPAPQVVKNAD